MAHVEFVPAGERGGNQFALFLVADVGVGVRFFEERENFVAVEPDGFVRRAGVAHDLDFLGEQRRAVGLLNEETQPQQVESGQPGNGACAHRTATRSAGRGTFGERLLHEELRERGDEAMVAPQVFRAFRRGRNEADKPVTGLCDRERGGDGGGQTGASLGADGDSKDVGAAVRGDGAGRGVGRRSARTGGRHRGRPGRRRWLPVRWRTSSGFKARWAKRVRFSLSRATSRSQLRCNATTSGISKPSSICGMASSTVRPLKNSAWSTACVTVSLSSGTGTCVPSA